MRIAFLKMALHARHDPHSKKLHTLNRHVLVHGRKNDISWNTLSENQRRLRLERHELLSNKCISAEISLSRSERYCLISSLVLSWITWWA